MPRTLLAALLALAAAAPAPAADDGGAARIVRVRRRGTEVLARGAVPPGFGTGSLAAATDDEGHVLGIVRLAGAAADRWRLEVVDTAWRRALRRGLELHWFADGAARGVPVWSERLGPPLLVDGARHGTLPAVVQLPPGEHELVAELPGGVRAGARITAPYKGRAVLLFGIGWPAGADPSLALDPEGFLEDGPGAPLRWVEVPGYGRFYHPGGPVTAPEKTEATPPRYPHRLRAAHAQGWARLLVLVADDGGVRAVARLGATRPEFLDLGVEAARRWRFAPARLRGRPVPGVFPLLLRWTLVAPP